MSRYVVDTHALVWYLENNPRLGSAANAAIGDPASVLYLPAIALAEACWITEHGRCAIPSVSQLLSDVDADPRIAVVPLDREVVGIANALTLIAEMHDRQRVATALRLSSSDDPVSLLSRDENIHASGYVPTVW